MEEQKLEMEADAMISEDASNVTQKLSENIFIRADRERQKQLREAESQADTADSSKTVLPAAQNTTIFKKTRTIASANESENAEGSQHTLATIEHQVYEQVRKEQVKDYHHIFTMISTQGLQKQEGTDSGETSSFNISKPDLERKAVKFFSSEFTDSKSKSNNKTIFIDDNFEDDSDMVFQQRDTIVEIERNSSRSSALQKSFEEDCLSEEVEIRIQANSTQNNSTKENST